MKFFNKKPQKNQKPPVPRSLEEIQRSYQELCCRAGELQYKIKIDQNQLDQTNRALLGVNEEGAARLKLDHETAEKSPKAASTPATTQEAANVQQ